MNFNIGNISKIVGVANAIKNPQEGINMLLDNYGKKNPEMANKIRQSINSGKNPKAFIMEQAQSGNITMQNLNDLKKYYGIAQKLGLSKKVPNSVWKEAENAIRNGANGSPRMNTQTNTMAQPNTQTNTKPNMFMGF